MTQDATQGPPSAERPLDDDVLSAHAGELLGTETWEARFKNSVHVRIRVEHRRSRGGDWYKADGPWPYVPNELHVSGKSAQCAAERLVATGLLAAKNDEEGCGFLALLSPDFLAQFSPDPRREARAPDAGPAGASVPGGARPEDAPEEPPDLGPDAAKLFEAAARKVAAARDGERAETDFRVGYSRAFGGGYTAIFLRLPLGQRPGPGVEWQRLRETRATKTAVDAARILLDGMLEEAESEAAALDERATDTEAKAREARGFAANIRGAVALARFILNVDGRSR